MIGADAICRCHWEEARGLGGRGLGGCVRQQTLWNYSITGPARSLAEEPSDGLHWCMIESQSVCVLYQQTTRTSNDDVKPDLLFAVL